MKLFKRAKNLWDLSNINPDLIKETLDIYTEPIGDGSAVYFSDGTEEELIEQRLEESGWRAIFNKFLGI